jgi:hypothetical protein
MKINLKLSKYWITKSRKKNENKRKMSGKYKKKKRKMKRKGHVLQYAYE